jgi:hypothetical protein
VWNSLKVLSAVVMAIALVSCSRTAEPQRPIRTFEPSVSPTAPAKRTPASEKACSLLTSDERRGLAGTTMDQVVPGNPAQAAYSCEWVHSLLEPATMKVSLDAMEADRWASRNGVQIESATQNSQGDKEKLAQLRTALRDIRRGPNGMTPERGCDIFGLIYSVRGFKPGDTVVFPYGDGRLNGVFAASCTAGVVVAVGYSEYGLVATAALAEAVMKLRAAAEERAIERFGPSSTEETAPTTKPRS